MGQISLSSLSAADQKALLAQAAAVLAERGDEKKNAATRKLEAYGTQITDFVTSVIEQEDVKTSEKSSWTGYAVRGVPVVIEGHTFTVSVTITDPVGKAKREAELAVKKAEATIAARDAALAAAESE